MKIIVSVLLTLVLTLAFGLVYADSNMTGAEVTGETSLNNGITYFDTGPTPDCFSVSGIGAGGLFAEGAEPALDNGVTTFELGMPGSGAIGLCAGSAGAEAPSAMVYNGITAFE